MIARVVDRRDRAGAALGVAALATAALALLAVEDFVHVRFLPLPAPPGVTYVVAGLFAAVALAPALVRGARPRAAEVAEAEGGLVLGDLRVRAEEVRGLSVARAARGASVAIDHAGHLLFVEVETPEDAARIARALRTGAGDRPVTLRAPLRGLGALQALASAVILAATPLYVLGAIGELGGGAKGIFGLLALAASFVSAALLVSRRFVLASLTRGEGLERAALGGAAWGRHAALHLEGDVVPSATLDERAARASGAAAALRCGEEPARAWLARLDVAPADGGAYRGDAMPRELLEQVLADDDAPLDARMGAARVLHRRHGEPRSVVRVVADPESRARVEAALEDPEEASARLAELGPIFRAR